MATEQNRYKGSLGAEKRRNRLVGNLVAGSTSDMATARGHLAEGREGHIHVLPALPYIQHFSNRLNQRLNKKIFLGMVPVVIASLGLMLEFSNEPLLASPLARRETPATASLETYRSEIDLSTKGIMERQSLLGDMVADVIRTSANTDISFVPGSTFSDNPVVLSKMGFTLPDLLKTIAYRDDNIGIVKLSGGQLRDALENSLYQYPNKSGGFLQTSGLVVSFDPSVAGGKRIVSIKVGGSTLATSKTYRVAMPMALANGAEGYFKYWKKMDIEKDTGVSLEAGIKRYLNDHKMIAKSEDRLVAISK